MNIQLAERLIKENATLKAEIARLKEAGRVVFQYALIRPADGYERAVADAAHVLYPTSAGEPYWDELAQVSEDGLPSETRVWL